MLNLEDLWNRVKHLDPVSANDGQFTANYFSQTYQHPDNPDQLIEFEFHDSFEPHCVSVVKQEPKLSDLKPKSRQHLTQKIFLETVPYANKFQGPEKRLLFVCSVGMLRSPTFADVATKMGFNARSCGTSKEALIPLSVNLILWADKIVFMNTENYLETKETFEPVDWVSNIDEKKKILGIEDDYARNDPYLESLARFYLASLKL
jgi:predicted protein tyrosine phosphatase